MKTMLFLVLVFSMASLTQATVQGTVLFSDSYNRPDSTNVDASSAGMSGALSPLAYVEIGDDTIYPVSSGTGLAYPELTQVRGNQLYLAYGSNMTTMYLDHNFVDSVIQAADGMRIGMTIVQDLGPQTGGQFFVGFGVGNTLQECLATWFDHNGTGFRGQINTTPPRAGTSDFWVGWSPANSGCIQVFKNGPTSAGGENYNLLTGTALTGSDRLELELFFDSFTDGSTVNANILWNGVVVGTDSFAWDSDGVIENYIGINGRQGTGLVVDNLLITTVFEDKAHNPVPSDGASSVDSGGLELNWDKGKDSSGNPNAAIVGHFLYIAEGEPNFVGLAPIIVPDTADPVVYGDYPFASDKVYYWRVDESVRVDDGASGPGDPNTIVGDVWSFDTSTYPAIDVQPSNVVRFPASDPQYEGPAELVCEFASKSSPTVNWFKEGDTEPLAAGGDITIDVSPTEDGVYNTTLAIDGIEIADEGGYYCRIINASGPANAAISNLAILGVKRLVAHWTMDEAAVVGGVYEDASGEGHAAVPDVVPDANFVDGADPVETAEGLDLAQAPSAAADAGRWSPYDLTGQMTLSLWCKWNGPNSAYQGLITKRDFDNGGLTAWYWELGPAGGLNFTPQGGTSLTVAAPAFETGTWKHLAVTAGPQGSAMYINGVAVATEAGSTLVSNDAQIMIGSNNRKAGLLMATFNGVLDDVRIYNYAMDATGIVDLYYDVVEIPVCLNPDAVDLQFDVAGGGADGMAPDCRVGLADLAVFARTWLNCGWYPQSECR